MGDVFAGLSPRDVGFDFERCAAATLRSPRSREEECDGPTDVISTEPLDDTAVLMPDSPKKCLNASTLAKYWLHGGRTRDPFRRLTVGTVQQGCSSEDAEVRNPVDLWRARLQAFLDREQANLGRQLVWPEPDPREVQSLRRSLRKHARDGDYLLALMEETPLAIVAASRELLKDRPFVIAAIEKNPYVFHYLPEALRADASLALAAVRKYGAMLGYLNSSLRNNRSVVLAAVAQDGMEALPYASAALQADRDVVLAAVKQNGRALYYASPQFQSDKAVVLAAVRQKGEALSYASQDLRADREVVLAAVQQDGQALQYASPQLQADRRVVGVAVRHHYSNLIYAAPHLVYHPLVALPALQNFWRSASSAH